MKEKLRTLFQQNFNPIEYRKVVLENLLHAQQLLSQPQFLEETNDGDRIYGLGYLTDADSKQIGLYYTVVVNSDVRRKRVGFRQMMKKYTDFGVDAAIAVFSDKEHWRLSYMSDLKGGETSAKRFSYILGDLNGQYNTPVNRLAKLGTQVSRLRLKDIFEAFSVETLSDEFFDLYRDHYADIVEYLTGKRMVKVDSKWVEKVIHAPLQSVYEQLKGVENADKIVRDYVKKMMGRIVFLHFLQKKEWLNDDTKFMQHTFSRNKDCQDDFLEKILEPLFFGFLNTRKEDRAKLFDKNSNWDKNLLTIWENIPYLNGGLFEQDEVDNLNIRLPHSMFDELFKFLAEYNFTVDENDPDDAEVGVDPEMLGKIFESLLEDNKAKGAFYTPKEIVRYMCKESLIAYLNSKVNSEKVNSELTGTQITNHDSLITAVRQFVEHHEMQPELEPYRDILDAALRNVKICDPAIGSGAFPMGLLNELWRCREALAIREANNLQDLQDFVSAASRSKLKKEIIENNIYGVDIERGAIDIARLRFWLSIVVDAEEPEPLPNFDYKFMQGNSLIESYKGIDLSRISNRLRGGQSKSTQLLLGLDSDFSKKNLQRLMRDYFSVTDHKQKSSMRQAINDEVKHLITDFIGGTAADLDKLDPSANQDFFLWHTWFKDIFDNGGFDIVIGNPPYFKYEGKNKNEIDSIRQTQYLEIAFGGKLNAYKLFLALSINKICKSNGIISLIFQNSFIADKQASILRREVINKHQIITIDSFPERDSKKKRVFENVKMSVCILLMQKSVTGKRFNVNFWNDKYKSSGTNIKFSADEIKRIDNEDYCIPRIEQSTIPLVIKLRQMKKFPLKCYEGELNMTFHKSFFNSNPNNPTILKGAAIQRYYITYRMSQGEIEYLDEKRFLSENSSEKAFHHEQERLAMQGMTGANDKIRLVMTIVPRGVYLANSCNYIIPTKELPAKYLLGLMNSHLMNWYFRCFSTNSNVNGYEVENFPMPNDNTDLRREITELVDTILRLKANNASVDTSEQEQQIDKLVYQLYNLTPEEIAVIEQ